MFSALPPSIKNIIKALSDLPSIGPRQATRIAFYLIGKGGNSIRELAQSLEELAVIKICERCFFPHADSGALCGICADASRDQGIIIVVEKETDLISLENTGKFRGRYFIIGPIPKIGTLAEWQKLRLENLKACIQKDQSGKVREIILGFNPTTVGDFNASLIAKELSGSARKLTRLGRGLPTGGEIEFADDETLGSSLDGRG